MGSGSFNIYKKLTLGFTITTLAIVAGSLFMYIILEKNISIVRKVANEHAPSGQKLNDLYFAVSNSKMLIKNWVFIEVKSNTPSKERLSNFHTVRYPLIKTDLIKLSEHWELDERMQMHNIFRLIEDSLIPQHRYIMQKLNSFESYDNPMILFETMSLVEQENDAVMALSNHILKKLDKLKIIISGKFNQAKIQMEESNQRFRVAIFTIGVLLMLISIAVGLSMSYMIIKPIRKLQQATKEISRGNLKVKVSLSTRDELQDLGENFDTMTETLLQSRLKLQRANTKLKLSQKSLEKSNATKDKFFSIIAHDLRAPFNAFVTVSDLLVNASDSLSEDRKKSFAKNIHQSAVQLNNLIENLLQWSRTQTNRLDFHPEKNNLNDIVEETITLAQTQAHNKNITIINNIQGVFYAVCDRNLIATVLRNLLSNAIKYTNHNGSVEIDLHHRDDNILEVSIKDNGIGIAAEDIEKLFRIDENTKYIGESTEKGTGLGLILCSEFIKQHGGNIFVESEVNKGSTFIFTIPLSQT